MPSSYTTSLRLTLPATGELAGQWGATVNTGITELLDAAVAGTTVISTWGGAGVPYTLSNNSGAADEARKMFLVATGTPGEAKNVICPAVSKLYVFRNDTTGGFALTLKTSGGTGIAVPAGQYKMLYCDGTNVVEAVNSAGALTLSGALSVGGTTTLASNPTLSAGTANGVLYLNGSKVATSGTALAFNGTTFSVSGNAKIGTGAASNSQTLMVNNPSGTATQIQLFQDGVESWTMGMPASSAGLAWAASGTEQMRLTSTGLGIGTSTPGYKLDVVGVGKASSAFAIGDSSGNLSGTFTNESDVSKSVTFNADPANVGASSFMRWNVDGSERMRLDASGNLGLGVTPRAWQGGYQAFDIKGPGAIASTASGDTFTQVANGAWFNGTNWIYQYSGVGAARYQMTGPTTGGAHSWWVAPQGTAGNAISFTQAMTLDASGNLLVGTTSSTLGRLEVVGGTGIRVNEDAAGTKVIQVRSAFAGGDPAINVSTNHALAFNTNNTERARITSGGDLLVGTTSGTGYKLSVYEGGANLNASIFTNQTATYATQEIWNQATSGDNVFSKFYTEGSATARGSIDYNRAGGLTRYNTTSDYRAKDIIGPVQNPGATIDALKVYEGVMKGATQSRPMLIAHEAQAHAPYAVSGVKDEVNEDGTPKFQQMDVSSLVPLLLAEIQSLRARVAALEAQP